MDQEEHVMATDHLLGMGIVWMDVCRFLECYVLNFLRHKRTLELVRQNTPASRRVTSSHPVQSLLFFCANIFARAAGESPSAKHPCLWPPSVRSRSWTPRQLDTELPRNRSLPGLIRGRPRSCSAMNTRCSPRFSSSSLLLSSLELSDTKVYEP